MKIKRLLSVIMSLAFIIMIIGCEDSFVFPKESEFSLDFELNSTTLNIGEELEVKAVFKNLSSSKYILNSSTKSSVIYINIYKLDKSDKPELKIVVGPSWNVEIKKKQEIIEERKILMQEEGEFKVVVTASFNIIDKENQESKSYLIKAQPLFIEVK